MAPSKAADFWVARVAGLVLVASIVAMAAVLALAAKRGFQVTVAAGELVTPAPAPDWATVLPMFGFSALAATAWGVILVASANAMRAALEGTTVMAMELDAGYGLRCRSQNSAEAPQLRDLHLLHVCAELAGWAPARLAEQMARAHCALHLRHRRREQPSGPAVSRGAVLRAELWSALGLLQNSLTAMPLPCAVFACLAALLTVGFGALGFFLMAHLTHMPNQDWDATWIEVSWQVLTLLFHVIMLFRAPQRALLLLDAMRRRHEHLVDGTLYSALCPGALLTRRQLHVVLALRLLNVLSQCGCSFVMWAFLSRALQETMVFHKDSATKPGLLVALFMVLGLGSDQASQALLQRFTSMSPYLAWLDRSSAGLVREAEVCSDLGPRPRTEELVSVPSSAHDLLVANADLRPSLLV